MQSSLLKVTFPNNYSVFNNESIVDTIEYFLELQSLLKLENRERIKIRGKKLKYTVFQLNFDSKKIKIIMDLLNKTLPNYKLEFINPKIYYLGPKNPILTLKI